MSESRKNNPPRYVTRFVQNDDDLRAVFRLRYEVFITEMGAKGARVDHEARLEYDDYDAVCEHLILVDTHIDPQSGAHVIGTYRLLSMARHAQDIEFYSQREFDLTPLLHSERRLLEVGRSCVARAHRDNTAILRLWGALGRYVQQHDIEIIFGVASFHGTDLAALTAPLAYLHQNHLAPPELRVKAHGGGAVFAPIDVGPFPQPPAIPPLIRAYLAQGGVVGEGAFVDAEFSTTDICLIVDIHRALSGDFNAQIKRWLQS